MTDTTTTPVDDFVAAPTDALVINASIDTVKAEKVYKLACTEGGVTNAKVYATKDEAKPAVNDLRKHVASRINDAHSVKVEWYKAGEGLSFRIRVVAKSNRGRKPAADKASS